MAQEHVEHQADTKIDATISSLWANVFGLIFLGITTGGFGALYLFTGHTISLRPNLLALATFALALGLGGLAHEVLHALGWMLFGRVPYEAIKFGFSWQGLMPYTHCKMPLKPSAYRIGSLLPGAVTGLLPGIVGLALGSLWLTMLGAVLLGAAGGDILVLWEIRSVPSNASILDHPTKTGCEVLGRVDIRPGNGAAS
ncbi:MAG: DUF3267 domain-containing protein [Anaerolineae bacterium]|nr:DUF3267 domain-containing protein [Anaerolineae bacterium]